MDPYQFLLILPSWYVSSYILIFIAMVFEGPIVTIASSSAASVGYFNIFVIFVLSLFGDIVGDLLHYVIGRFVRESIIEKYGKYIGLKKVHVENIEKNLKTHLGKTLFIVKMTPPLTTAGLILTGASKVKPEKFLFWSFIITLPRTIFFTFIGYYFGLVLVTILKYLKWGGYGISAIIITTLVVYFVSKSLSKKIVKKNIGSYKK